MTFADRFNDFVKHFVHYVTDATLEGFKLLWRGLAFNRADGIVHLAIDAQEGLKNVFRGFRIFKQGQLRVVEKNRFVENDSATLLINGASVPRSSQYSACAGTRCFTFPRLVTLPVKKTRG